MNGFFGQQKLREYMNYDNTAWAHKQLYIYRYSQEYAEGLIGKVNHFFKFFGD